MELRNETLIITGASLGIGRAVALELAQHGVNLVLNARHKAPLQEAAAACAVLGVQTRVVAGNAAREQTAAALVAAAVKLGNLFGFIHAAGVLHPGPFLWELPPRRFQEVLASHVTAAYQLSRQALPVLLDRGAGLAVLFGSGAAVSNLPGLGAYAVAKAAEEHLARQLAAEAPAITTFIFRPGVTETRMQQQARQARGGAAAHLRQVFRGYRERGELRSPEAEARRLVRLLLNDPRRYQGRTAG